MPESAGWGIGAGSGASDSPGSPKYRAPPPQLKLPPGLEARKLVYTEEQGKPVEYPGVLRPAGFVWRRPSRFRLVRYTDVGNPVTVCFVLGNEGQLKSVIGEQIVLFGRKYWVQGVREPVVAAERIVRQP